MARWNKHIFEFIILAEQTLSSVHGTEKSQKFHKQVNYIEIEHESTSDVIFLAQLLSSLMLPLENQLNIIEDVQTGEHHSNGRVNNHQERSSDEHLNYE